MAPALNYTTAVPVARTTAEMQAILGKAGANAVATMYEDGKPVGMSFSLATPSGERSFTLPVDVPAVQKLLTAQKRQHSRVDDRPAQAERVAWRIVKDWLAAQLALIDAQMASLDEVMLPYLVTAPHRTLREDWRDRIALGPGEDDR
jgi:hypothetical protein